MTVTKADSKEQMKLPSTLKKSNSKGKIVKSSKVPLVPAVSKSKIRKTGRNMSSQVHGMGQNETDINLS